MKKKYIVKEKKEFNQIISKKQFITNNYFVIYYINNQLKYNRYGITVGTKVGNAVIRNRLKRQLRSIVDNNKKDYSKNKDYIIMVRSSCLNVAFQELTNNYIDLIERINKRKEN